jgi:thiol-disulfide isomerase/thioredoxin
MTTTRLFYLCFFLIMAFGCSRHQTASDIVTHTVISGQIKNLDVYPTTKEFTVEIRDFRDKKTIISDSIKSDGTFKLEFDLFIAQDIDIQPIVGRIIAHPGDSIHLDLDFKDMENVKFTGDAQQSNTQLQKYLNSNYTGNEFFESETYKFLSSRSEKHDFMSYKVLCDSLKKVMDKNQIDYIKEMNPNAEIRKWAIENMKIQYYESLLSYPLNNSKIENESVMPPAEYFNFLDSVGKVFNNVLLNTDGYKLLGYYSAAIWNKKAKSFSRDSAQIFFMKEIINTVKIDLFKQMLIGNFYYNFLNLNSLEFFENNKAFFDANVREPFIKIPLENYYQRIKRDTENPKIASDVILGKVHGTVAKNIMDSILINHKGKVIYMDFWATYCGPCKEEMPNSKELIKKYGGKDVAFVFVCIESNEKNWKLDLSQLQLAGSHYLCNPEQSSGIRKGLGIEGIPFYVLINKQGQITESGNLLRPGNIETQKKIDKLLNEK